MIPVDTSLSPIQEPTIVNIENTQNKEDILAPREVVIPPGGVTIRLINNSSFYVEFNGSTKPSDGSLKPKSQERRSDSIDIQVMPGNEIMLSPYPHQYQFIRFIGSR